MNMNDRKVLKDIVEKISAERDRLEEMQTSIQGRAENLEEHFPWSDRAANLEEEADRLQESIDNLDTVQGELTSMAEGEGF